MRKGASILSLILMIPVFIYQWFISPLKGPSCRHIPTCSTYSIQALRKHGPWQGLRLGANRILRCRPGGTHGYDPVPAILVRKYRPKDSRLGKMESCNRLKEH